MTPLEYIVNHVFLTPKLPNTCDDGDPANEKALLAAVLDASRLYRAELDDSDESIWVNDSAIASTWDSIIRMIANVAGMRDGTGFLVAERVENALEQMQSGDLLAFQIHSQNASLMIERDGERYIFEAFELSPTAEAVMEAQGRLRRCFPESATVIDGKRIRDCNFRRMLAELLAQLDADPIPDGLSINADETMPHSWSTPAPDLVLGMLMTMLAAMGYPMERKRIWKHYRDDCLGSSAAPKPWRRSPLWTMLRVVVQTVLIRFDPSAKDHHHYKAFMLFFLAQLAQKGLETGFPNEILMMMLAKISRRALKLDHNGDDAWYQIVQDVVEGVRSQMLHKWRVLQAPSTTMNVTSLLENTEALQSEDAVQKLENLGPYLNSITQRSQRANASEHPLPKESPRALTTPDALPSSDGLRTMSDNQARLPLADIERWVSECLQTWHATHLTKEDALSALNELLVEYVNKARVVYDGDPRSYSSAVLTSMELWVAFDSSTIHHVPFLRKYHPELPDTILDALLLPTRDQMRRLSHIETYLQSRRDGALPKQVSPFHVINNSRSLSVLYYDESPTHQDLHRQIVDDAKVQLENRRRDLERMQRQYEEKNREAEALRCDIYDHKPHTCEKCKLEKATRQMKMSRYEWPLPAGDINAKAAVFELQVPEKIATWRNTTYSVLADLLCLRGDDSENSGPGCTYSRALNSGRLELFSNNISGRLRIVSATNAFEPPILVTRLTSENILIAHKSEYAIFDTHAKAWAEPLADSGILKDHCTLRLPDGPYKCLQAMLANTEHNDHQVIARQSECTSLAPYEFCTFGALRAGHRLQWMNIVRAIRASEFDLNSIEVALLLEQSAWQAGSAASSNILRQSHEDFDQPAFVDSLLLTLEEAFDTVEGDWQNVCALHVFATLTARLLSLLSNADVQTRCFRYLTRLRTLTLQWTRDLYESSDHRALEPALACHSTFHVDKQHVDAVLTEETDLVAFFECCLIIHNFRPTKPEPALERRLRATDHASHSVETHIRHRVLQNPTALGTALKRVWIGFRPDQTWTTLHGQSSAWLTTTCAATGEGRPTTSCYNILDGSLLVNGLPFSRLPREYEQHPTFARLFPGKVFHVVPTTQLGMRFQVRTAICGYQVFFGLDGVELLVRVQRGSDQYEILPEHRLLGDFPSSMIRDYAHWLDLTSQAVQWRPLSDMWKDPEMPWLLHEVKGRHYVHMGPSMRLLDVYSPTVKRVSEILEPIEDAEYLQVTSDAVTGTINVHLQRLKLDFSAKLGELELQSKQFRGSIIDSRQGFGALTGLKNKLVIRHNETGARSVIIPYGDVQPYPLRDHVAVEIFTSGPHVLYYHFSIDHQLGQLQDNSGLSSRLFKCLLHAVTSHCLPDELTGATGTEEALTILSSAAVHSFSSLGTVEQQLLQRLACLTPRRRYTNPNCQAVQTVTWKKLPQLSQHEQFHPLVASILDEAKALSLFTGNRNLDNLQLSHTPSNLSRRARIRAATFHVDGFGAEDHCTSVDLAYLGRQDHLHDGQKARVHSIAQLVDAWSTQLTVLPELFKHFKSWGKPIIGNPTGETLPLSFDFSLLRAHQNLLPDLWSRLHPALSSSSPATDKYGVMIVMSALAYARQADEKLLHSILAFATVDELRGKLWPHTELHNLGKGDTPDNVMLRDHLQHNLKEMHQWPRSGLKRKPLEDDRLLSDRRIQHMVKKKDEALESLIGDLTSQWPCAEFKDPHTSTFRSYFAHEAALAAANGLLRDWYRNHLFRMHIQEAQEVLSTLTPTSCTPEPAPLPELSYKYQPRQSYIAFVKLLKKTAPLIRLDECEDFSDTLRCFKSQAERNDRLEALLAELTSQATDAHGREYFANLMESLQAPQNAPHLREIDVSYERLRRRINRARDNAQSQIDSAHSTICQKLERSNRMSHSLVFQSGTGPRTTKLALLRRLALWNASDSLMKPGWRNSIINLGVLIARHQFFERLMSSLGNKSELLSELLVPQTRSWDVNDRPEWLLFEISNNITIRPNQARIAKEMISPSSGANSVLQLNMGEGKSSVIVPIVAASLANSKTLVRVVVLDALALQMYQLLQTKLGSLLNRRIFWLPISRSMRLDRRGATQLQELYERCMSTGGILLAQPEHLCSLELLGVEKAICEDNQLAKILNTTQSWLDDHSRDVLDESDEILGVRFELVYTIGTQQAVDFSPKRWTIIQHLLTLVSRVAATYRRTHNADLEVEPIEPGRFPTIRILGREAIVPLIRDIASEICEAHLPELPVWSLPKDTRASIQQYLTEQNHDAAYELEELFDEPQMRKALHLLRGVLCDGGLLALALHQKRWRVDYGLDLGRNMVAVPYTSKDTPSARADFSSPDTAIILSCLAYYYGGLTDDQLQLAFHKLLATDDASEEYELWIRGLPDIPSTMRQLKCVNIANEKTRQELFPILRRSKGAVDFFLSNIAFPKEIREFPSKLSLSAWDLAREKAWVTTGFSGTNDSRYLLPLSIKQTHLSEELHTNASQLASLLQDENTYLLGQMEPDSEILTAKSLLTTVVNARPLVRVILDVGAQVLEWHNETLARNWLQRVPETEAQAAVFVNDHNELVVLDRDNAIVPLVESPFLAQMDQCLVYLDEAHTRGTDLKLPSIYRAAVTLGPQLTKDRLVQACMRMRKLGKGQSVVLIGSKEIEKKISTYKQPDAGTTDVADVLRWCMHETLAETARNTPRWAAQGMRYQRRFEARQMLHGFDDPEDSEGEAEAATAAARLMIEPEARTIDERYGNRAQTKDEEALFEDTGDEGLARRAPQVAAIRQKCVEFSLKTLHAATLDEEEERELAPENEMEREVEKPPQQPPCKPKIHRDLERLVGEGALPSPSRAFTPVFHLFADTTAALDLRKRSWCKDLLMTTEYAKTIRAPRNFNMDNFLRPTNWLLTFQEDDTTRYIVLSPFEVNELLPAIREHGKVTLHVYAPRIAAAMPSFDDLAFCTVPSPPAYSHSPSAVMRLGLFAGSLYLRSYDEYLALCRFLGILYKPPPEGVRAQSDGFIVPACRNVFDPEMARSCSFPQSPVSFLCAAISMRRKGQTFERSHLGRMLRGERLREEDFTG